MTEIAYFGTELELFAHATNWKSYWGRQVRPHLSGRVLEVGAGLGGTTRVLCGLNRAGPPIHEWVGLEPDPGLAGQMRSACADGGLPSYCRVQVGTLADLPARERFDAIIYIDVLEHIADDRAELAAAADRLLPGGRLVVLAPAHQWLFTPFDTRIGHFRRYSRESLTAAAPTDRLALQSVRYLDCVGLLASLGNRLLLSADMPTRKQVLTWDRLMVPLSRMLDRPLGYNIGKSVLGVWQRR